jgi:hypothetical protein
MKEIEDKDKRILKIGKYCGMHLDKKCVCLDRPFLDPFCQYCEYNLDNIKKTKEREE